MYQITAVSTEQEFPDFLHPSASDLKARVAEQTNKQKKQKTTVPVSLRGTTRACPFYYRVARTPFPSVPYDATTTFVRELQESGP